MITFSTIILQFAEQGEKTGWSYIEIPADIAQQLKPGNKKSFRVRGMLDGLAVNGMALMPMGNGVFIMALKAEVRKALHKNSGAMLQVSLEEDKDYKVELPDDLKECFEFEPEASDFFNGLAKSHRDYFIKWINGAKTSETRAKRIINTVNAMLRKWDYGQMLREMKGER
ncbi:YdeI/OmpD-associated family protein [Mucilaginibacter sp. OK098]|uniref:YdeI/OmpD-associated family protein n=1 Tax=Mucilaginibacter sp. OK098 TaxID=1855297 RepID=UPI00091FB890|nr:YdeI/OmpD-associated family protein [Mucilaginibacter sp. OK098]SHN33109.1 Bacteriocin-protection, YdeI or OmpD-Associated [Mucilaginibacter sp. OK098]